MMPILFAILAGISVTMQNSLNGLMTPIVGAMGVSLAGFTIQTILMTGFQLGTEKNLSCLKKIPVIYYSSGLISTFVVGILGICVARMGSTVTQCCSVAGQILMSTIVDHFGLFGNKKHYFTVTRLPGFALILGGVLAMNLIGNNTSSNLPLPLLLIGICLGACAVMARTMNSRASQYADSAVGGGITNSVGGMASGLIFFLFMTGFHPDFSSFAQVPLQYYLAGAFGTACCLCNIAAYKNSDIFYSTIFMLMGQVVTGILMDICVFHTLSFGRCIGISIVFAGILMDKFLTRKNNS